MAGRNCGSGGAWKTGSRKFHVKKGKPRGSYSRNNKAAQADRYGEFAGGVRRTPDRIAGRVIN